jgi:hypothetical protein
MRLLSPLSKTFGRPISWLLSGIGGEKDQEMLEVRHLNLDRSIEAIARLREELGRRSASLEERELAQLNDTALLETRAAELERREQAIEERVAALSAREALISRLEAELRWRTADLARDAWELAAAQEAVAAAQSELAAERRALDAMRIGTQTHAALQTHLTKSRDAWARCTLPELRRLVNKNESTYPDRREEWLTYMRQLEEFANSDGQLPAAFQGLIEEVFSPLLESAEQDARWRSTLEPESPEAFSAVERAEQDARWRSTLEPESPEAFSAGDRADGA